MGFFVMFGAGGGGWMFRHRRLLEFMAAEPFGANPQAIEEKL